MWPPLFWLGKTPVTIWAGVIGLSLIWASFELWRKMRWDYAEEEILKLTEWLVGAAIVGGGMGERMLYHRWGLWSPGAVAASWLVLWWWCRRKKWDVWEWLDVYGGILLGIGVLGNAAWGIERWPNAAGMLIGVGVRWWASKKYRTWRWYKSGKVGLLGLISILWWGGVEIAVAIASGSRIYWGGLTAEQWLAAWTTAAALTAIYIRSGRKISEEFRRK